MKVLAAFLLGGFLAFMLFLFAMLASASAHDHWIADGKFKGPDGQSCCGKDDCEPIAGNMVSITPAGFYLKQTGETIAHSEAKDSQDGKFWRCRYLTGVNEGKTRCFFKVEPGL
jgi:hypothetical protein